MNPQNDPYLDAGVRGHIVKMARRYARSIAGADVEDLIQEGYACYYHCRNRYVGRRPVLRPDGSRRRSLPPKCPDREARRHFMSIFQTSLRNRLITLSQKQSARQELNITDLAREDQMMTEAWESVLPVEEEVATVSVLLSAAPH